MIETVITDRKSPHCDIDVENSKPIFLHYTLAHDNASQHQAWLQKVQKLRYRSHEHLLKLSFSFDLDPDYNRKIEDFYKTVRHLMMCHQAKFNCKRISSSENILESHILDI